MIKITAELDNAGVLDALTAMVKARDELAGIAVTQASREPITNLINNLLNMSGLLTSLNPEVTENLKGSISKGD